MNTLDTVRFMIQSYNIFLNTITKNHTYNTYNLSIESLNHTYNIPNNNNKWYCCIIPGTPCTVTPGTLKNITMFFFDNKGVSFYINKIVSEQVYQEFSEVLLEGYMSDTKELENRVFSITDILVKNAVMINKVYQERLYILNTTMKHLIPYLQDLDGVLSIEINENIHSEKDITFTDLQKICISSQLFYIEKVENFKKTCISLIGGNGEHSVEKKLVKKTKIPDVYNVFNNDSGLKEGIAYVKSISDSRKLTQIFLESDEQVLDCRMNTIFQRWEVEFSGVL